MLGKPGDHAGNVAQLEMANGRWLEFRTGLAVLDTANGHAQLDVARFAVKFRTVTTDDIEAYVAREQAFDCSGWIQSGEPRVHALRARCTEMIRLR